MVQVKISYNIYLDAMSIYIDGKPIPQISRLTRFQTMSFGNWCGGIFQAIGEEVNDRFSLTYVGRPCESRILGRFMGAYPDCVSYSNRQPEIADSAQTRLKKLSSLCQSGAACERFSAAVHIYSDLSEDILSPAVSACLPKLAYCRITPKYHPLQEAARHQDSSPAFVITSGEPQLLRSSAGMCILSLTPGDRMVTCRDNCFAERISRSELEQSLKDYAELLFFPWLLKKALKALRVPEGSPLFPSAAVLDKTEPQTLVTLPGSVELGQVAAVKVRTVPEGATPANLIYRISDESVIRMTDQGIQGVGTGEAVVEVYISGQASKIASGKVTAYRRNRIRKLCLQQSSLELCVGDRTRLSYTFEPRDADNESSIRLVSSNGTVAAPESGTSFVARAPGDCRMILQAEQVSADIRVTVYPRLEQLILECTGNKCRVGELLPVKVTRVPADATLDQLEYSVNPPSLGVYDISTRSFYAKAPGTGTLTVSSKTHPVSVTQELNVRGKGNKAAGKGCLLPVLATLGTVILFIISQFI